MKLNLSDAKFLIAVFSGLKRTNGFAMFCEALGPDRPDQDPKSGSIWVVPHSWM